ncbi:MAG: FemAB family XrtA/PEP-CTERM system-associated protein [Steroidobacteraceae bacterium]
MASPADAAEWDASLGRLVGASFYHLFAWQAINELSFGHRSIYLIARNEGRISGILPLTLVASQLFGRILCSMPFMNFGGPCADDNGVVNRLLEHGRQLARENAADYLELRCRAPLPGDMPVSLRKISMVLQLDADPTLIWSGFSAKHRTNIRRAEKNNLVVSSGGRELLPEFYHVMEHSWRELGTPLYARSYFEQILAHLPGATRIFLCSRRGEPVATALNGYFGGTVEGLWNGGVAEARSLSANYVLYWAMIRDGCERGFQRFHLGRSTVNSSSETFKRKWNAEKLQLYWYFWRPDGGNAPNLNVDNPRFRMAIAAWRRLPLVVTRVLGPRVARAIP